MTIFIFCIFNSFFISIIYIIRFNWDHLDSSICRVLYFFGVTVLVITLFWQVYIANYIELRFTFWFENSLLPKVARITFKIYFLIFIVFIFFWHACAILIAMWMTIFTEFVKDFAFLWGMPRTVDHKPFPCQLNTSFVCIYYLSRVSASFLRVVHRWSGFSSQFPAYTSMVGICPFS